MFFARRPSPAEIERFLHESARAELSYPSIGIAQGAPRGYTLDEASVVLGRGVDVFRRAVDALHAWRHFSLGWVELFPRLAPAQPGSVVAVLIQHLGFWSLNGCRVVYTLEPTPDSRAAGFAYGTLANHAEMGEEIFRVSMRADNGEVAYEIRAVSKPRALLAQVGYPFTRSLQARFRRDSLQAMQSVVRD